MQSRDLHNNWEKNSPWSYTAPFTFMRNLWSKHGIEIQFYDFWLQDIAFLKSGEDWAADQERHACEMQLMSATTPDPSLPRSPRQRWLEVGEDRKPHYAQHNVLEKMIYEHSSGGRRMPCTWYMLMNIPGFAECSAVLRLDTAWKNLQGFQWKDN